MRFLQRDDTFYREPLVNVTAALPERHIASCHLVDVAAQVVVGAKQYLRVLRQLVYHLLRVAARHHHVGQCLHRRRRVHVAHHQVVGMLVLESLQVLGLARVGQRASRSGVGAEHHLLRRQQLARLRHEVNAAHHDDLCIGISRLTGQGERVAHEVGHLLHLAHRVVVGQDHSILLFRQLSDGSLQSIPVIPFVHYLKNL